MTNQFSLSINKRKIIIFLFLLLLLITGWWLFKQTYIVINLESSPTGSYEITLVNQDTGETIEDESSSQTYKKRVERGLYEVRVTHDYSTHIAVTETSQFFQESILDVTFKPQNEQTFIGNNPHSCVDTTNSTLISWACNESINSAFVHRPATNNKPSFTEKLRGFDTMIIEGMIELNNNRYAFMKIESHDGGEFFHGLYPFDNELGIDINNGRILEGVSSPDSYDIKPYSGGFLIYTKADEEALFYNSANDEQPNTINIPTSDEVVDLSLVDFIPGAEVHQAIYSQDSFAFSNYNSLENNISSLHEDEGDNENNTHTTLVTEKEGVTNEYTFSVDTSDVKLCGETYICALSDNSLEVYSIENGSKTMLYSLNDVQKILNTKSEGQEITITRSDGVVVYDLDSMQGDYSFKTVNEEGMCGATSTQPDIFAVCARATSNEGSSLILIDTTKESETPLLTRLESLRALPEVNSLSVYKDKIFISPEVGPMVYKEEIGEYGYSESQLSTTARVITDKTEELRLNEDYRIINTLE